MLTHYVKGKKSVSKKDLDAKDQKQLKSLLFSRLSRREILVLPPIQFYFHAIVSYS
jgi:hypothetical protein